MTKSLFKNLLTKFVLIVLICCMVLFFNACSASNAKEYDPEFCEKKETALTDKTMYWLGSSVTLGMRSDEVSVPEYIAARNGAVCVKDAISGTTLMDEQYKGSDSYVTRLKSGEIFDKTKNIDAFICQISTNDAKKENIDKWGELTANDITDKAVFDLKTTIGAMEYIIAYVVEVWDCPIYFFSGSNFSDKGLRSVSNPKGSDYGKLVEKTYEIAQKWTKLGFSIGLIDLFNDKDFNDISDKDFKTYMHDAVHPYKAGYLKWWTPYFEEKLMKDFGV